MPEAGEIKIFVAVEGNGPGGRPAEALEKLERRFVDAVEIVIPERVIKDRIEDKGGEGAGRKTVAVGDREERLQSGQLAIGDR
jgi:hypothetical protein